MPVLLKLLTYTSQYIFWSVSVDHESVCWLIVSILQIKCNRINFSFGSFSLELYLGKGVHQRATGRIAAVLVSKTVGKCTWVYLRDCETGQYSPPVGQECFYKLNTSWDIETVASCDWEIMVAQFQWKAGQEKEHLIILKLLWFWFLFYTGSYMLWMKHM